MRRVRPWVVVAGCLLALAAAAAIVARTQGDLLRESAAHYLQERLADEFGAQFQAGELRGRWFPPDLSLGRVTFQRPGEPWVLTAEDVRISFNLYAMLFRRERLGRVVVERPRLFVRPAVVSAGTPLPEDAAQAPAVRARAIAERARGFLRPPFPLRILEIVDGFAQIQESSGRVTTVRGLALDVAVSSGRAQVACSLSVLEVAEGARETVLEGLEGEAVLEEQAATVSRLAVARGPLQGEVRGIVGYDGKVALEGDVTAALGPLTAFLGQPAAEGVARFAGSVRGRWDDPEASGDLSLGAPVFRGRRWPDAKGAVAWSGRRLTWSDVRVAAGTGEITSSGSADFSQPRPRYRLEARARDAEPARLVEFIGRRAEAVLSLDGTFQWEGSGTGTGADGAGSLEATLNLASWPDEKVALQTRASLAGGALTLGELRVSGGGLEASGSGAWQPEAGFSGKVSGAVADIARLQPAARRGEIALGGSGVFAGDIAQEKGGMPQFSGTVTLSRASAGKLTGVDAAARLDLSPRRLRLSECTLAWPGGRGALKGTVDFVAADVTLESTLEDLSLQEAARLLNVDGTPFAGRIGAVLSVRGSLRAPVVAGRVTGRDLHFRRAIADAGSLSFAYAGRRLDIDALRLRRGVTELAFSGELRDGRMLEGEFESPTFDASDIVPGSRLDLAGSLRGRVHGPLESFDLEGTLRAERLRYAGVDFRGGEVSVDYRGGKAALKGWLGTPENRLRAVVEPAQGWRFESDLELRQFAPELVRSGTATLPPELARLVGQASFLAAGRLAARGRLREPSSLSADLELGTLWLQASGQTLQNRAPVRLSWRDGGLRIDDFRLAGAQYRLDVAGTGHPTAGWDLHAEGAVDLAFFAQYWPELEEVDGTGDLQLTLRGPWASPAPEGSLTVHDVFVKARALPEPLDRLSGRVELRGRTLRATDLEGTIGGSAFRGRGSYSLATGEVDGEVEGRFDLALFRGRVPAARDMRGQVQVRLGFSGPVASPALSGSVEVIDAELFVRNLPAKITGLNGRLTVGTDRIEAIELTGQTGGGKVALSGSLGWGPPGRVALDLRGDGILVTLADGLKAQADLRLALSGDFAALKLAGEVRILKARYLREFTDKPPPIAAGGSGAAETASRSAGPDLSRMALDVKVRATDNVWVANRMAKIEAGVALDVGGTLGAPEVRGEITAIRGEAFYLSRQFRLESGALRFVPPEKVPQLDLQASTTVGETQILFLMDGPLNKPTYHLVSLPPMNQEDLVALLTIGETRKGIARGGEMSSSVGAAVFTTEPLVNALGDEARSSMGLEVLQLEPIVGADNRVSARVTLGTRLSDRVFVSYSQNLGATEDQQFLVQYYLLDYLSLWGQELRQGIYSVDLVFRYTFR